MMESEIKKDIDLIQSLGGCAAVARQLNKSPQCVFNWTKRGIPARVKLEHRDIFLTEKEKRNDK